jgi:hypothetical protein
MKIGLSMMLGYPLAEKQVGLSNHLSEKIILAE